jgi:hypothetical protein
MTTIDNLVSIRELTKEDINFLLNSSIQCLSQYTESIVKGQNRLNAYQLLEKIILYGLNRIDYSIFIACRSDDSNDIVGYIVADTKDNHIFLQYTKYSYRKLGIQKNLLLPLVVDPSLPITVNWPTKEMLKLAANNTVTIQNKFVETLIDTLYFKENA